MPARIRIGNIEYCESKRPNGTGTYEEIVLLYPNKYFGKKESMLKDGYSENTDGSLTKGNTTISASCFAVQECRCLIATIVWNKSHDEFDVNSVGTRAFKLDDTNTKNFKRTLELIEEMNAREA